MSDKSFKDSAIGSVEASGCGEGPCLETQEHLWDYIDGELSAEECARIKAHVEACPPCEALYRDERTVKDVVARACGCESAPQDLRGRVVAMVKQLRFEACSSRRAGAADAPEGQAQRG